MCHINISKIFILNFRLGGNGEQKISLTTLILGYDDGVYNTIGLRFTNIGIAKNSIISKARVQFVCKSARLGTLKQNIYGHLSDNSPPFTTTPNFELTMRRKTISLVQWEISNIWFSEDSYETPNVATIIQEVVNLENWQAGNALSLIFTRDPTFSSSYERLVYSADDDINKAAELIIEFTPPPPSAAPTAAPTTVKVSVTTPKVDEQDSEQIFNPILGVAIGSSALVVILLIVLIVVVVKRRKPPPSQPNMYKNHFFKSINFSKKLSLKTWESALSKVSQQTDEEFSTHHTGGEGDFPFSSNVSDSL